MTANVIIAKEGVHEAAACTSSAKFVFVFRAEVAVLLDGTHTICKAMGHVDVCSADLKRDETWNLRKSGAYRLCMTTDEEQFTFWSRSM